MYAYYRALGLAEGYRIVHVLQNNSCHLKKKSISPKYIATDLVTSMLSLQ